MTKENILLRGELLGAFTAPDGVRFVYEIDGNFVSCLDGGLAAQFEDADYILDQITPPSKQDDYCLDVIIESDPLGLLK